VLLHRGRARVARELDVLGQHCGQLQVVEAVQRFGDVVAGRLNRNVVVRVTDSKERIKSRKSKYDGKSTAKQGQQRIITWIIKKKGRTS
jgi:hypothetical protein